MVLPLLISNVGRDPRRLFPWMRPGTNVDGDAKFKEKIQKNGLEG